MGQLLISFVDSWRDMMAHYLERPLPNGRRLLLILDGIDEAIDWEAGPALFPFSLPPNSRILVSARFLAGDIDASGWLRRLGWDRSGLAYSIDLCPLSREGIADVLNRMGFPLNTLGARVDIVAELHCLSEGDPLLVRLYVDDLWARGEIAARLRPEELRHIKPGLEGYFARWWEDQRRLWGDKTPLREVPVQALFNLLACALGPLSQKDVLKLAPPEAALTVWTLEEVLRFLNRFVIGDGVQQGYAFSHPRLGAYFYDKVSKAGRPAGELRFLAWGEETLKALNEEQMPPAEASPYIIQYYGIHLKQAGCSMEALVALISEGWQKACTDWKGLTLAFWMM